MKGYKDYYYGYTDKDGKLKPGYILLVQDLQDKFPLDEQILEKRLKKEFISLFGAVLRMRNLLASFDEFAGKSF